MKIERIWAMPNKNTFSIKPIKKLIEEEKTLWVHHSKNLACSPWWLAQRYNLCCRKKKED
ncbi:hypothetical protein ABDJ34_08100 [Finegoldia dalianensis]|uniref:Uncharacterized protein n=1 Tax=Finegoldia dalianensis TaxID=3145239 RepID=A0ABW9KDT7_9FIRM